MTISKSSTNTTTILLILLLSPFATAQDQYEDRASPPAATIVIILIGVLFVLTGFLSIYLRHHAASCFGIQEPSGGIGLNRSAQRGLDPAVIRKFPVYLYSDVKVHRKGEVALECAVCLNEYEDHESLRLLPICNHVFHPNCVDPWLVTRGTCPVCRANLEKVTEFDNTIRSPPVLQNSAENESDSSVHHHVVNVDRSPSPEIRRSPTPEIVVNQSRPSRGLKDKIIGRFPRSHSTGHSIFRSRDDWERFTLRLPEEVRNKLVNLNRLTSNGTTLSALNSPKSGFRSGNYYQRWGLTMTPPFISRARSPISDGDEWNGSQEQRYKGGFLKSLSPLIDRMMVKGGGSGSGGDMGERSSDKLRPPPS